MGLVLLDIEKRLDMHGSLYCSVNREKKKKRERFDKTPTPPRPHSLRSLPDARTKTVNEQPGSHDRWFKVPSRIASNIQPSLCHSVGPQIFRTDFRPKRKKEKKSTVQGRFAHEEIGTDYNSSSRYLYTNLKSALRRFILFNLRKRGVLGFDLAWAG